MSKAMGWFLVGLLLFPLKPWALNLDFEKEIQKREIVSVRLSEDLKSSQKEAGEADVKDSSLPKERERDASGTFSVRLRAISR